MLFRFFRHQLEPVRPTISSTARLASENGQMDIGGGTRVEGVGDGPGRPAAPVIIVKAPGGQRRP